MRNIGTKKHCTFFYTEKNNLGRILNKPLTDLPVLVGVGVGTPEQAMEAASHGDGVVIGSAVVQRMVDGAGPEGVGELVAAFRSALDAS